MFDLTDKHILITGSGSGIGLALAEHFKNAGCKVSGLDLSITKELTALNVTTAQTDVSDKKSLQQAFAQVVAENGKLDAIINNAGIAVQEGSLGEADIIHLERAFDVNVKGVYLGMQLAFKYMNEGGAIVNTASLAATITLPEYCAYSMSKAAVVQMTKNAALQLSEKSIRVNSVSPGTVLTPMESEDGEEANLAKISTALSRPAKTDDLVGVYHFLLSDASKYITGIDIKVDGGWSSGITYKSLAKLAS